MSWTSRAISCSRPSTRRSAAARVSTIRGSASRSLDNVLDNSGADFGANAVFIDQVDALALLYIPGYAGSPNGEGLGGTASADIDAFLVGEGNSMVNGAILLQPGFVYADFVNDMTGASFALPVWFP